jgi:hypothetical protein
MSAKGVVGQFQWRFPVGQRQTFLLTLAQKF